jgi:hypothetical protein
MAHATRAAKTLLAAHAWPFAHGGADNHEHDHYHHQHDEKRRKLKNIHFVPPDMKHHRHPPPCMQL